MDTSVGSAEPRIVCLLLTHGCHGAVTGAEERFLGEREDLVPDLLAREVQVFAGTADGTGEDGIADDGDVRGVLRPCADDVGDAVLCVSGRVAIGDPQAAEHDEVVGAVALFDGGALGAGVDAGLGMAFTDGTQGGEVIGVGMRDEDVTQHQLVFVDEPQHGGGVETGVEQGGVPGDLVPDQIGVHRHVIVGGGDDAEFAPLGHVRRAGQPAVVLTLQACTVEAQSGAEFLPADTDGGLPGGFELMIGSGVDAGRVGRRLGRGLRGDPGLAEDVADGVFEIHVAV